MSYVYPPRSCRTRCPPRSQEERERERNCEPTPRPFEFIPGYPYTTRYHNLGYLTTPYPGKMGIGDYGPVQSQFSGRPGTAFDMRPACKCCLAEVRDRSSYGGRIDWY